jgi:two-component system sensor histidine kinase PhoQ
LARSIRARLIVGAALVLVAFMAVAGVALQRAHADGVRAAHYARLQSTVYLLLAGAELDAAGFAASCPRIRRAAPVAAGLGPVCQRAAMWRGASCGVRHRLVGLSPPFDANAPVGEWRYDTVQVPSGTYGHQLWRALGGAGQGRGAAGAVGAGEAARHV